jgi:ribosome maturation factor RimP
LLLADHRLGSPFWGFFVAARNSRQGGQMSGKEAQLTQLLRPTVESMGYSLWGIELISPGKRPTVRLYIEAEAGVTVDDCAQVSHQVSGVLDVEDPIKGEYTLEVSSPGVDRLLFDAHQYVPFVGEMVDIRLRLPVEGRRRFKGTLMAVDSESVVVIIDEQEFTLPLRSVDRARAYPRLEISQGKQ